MKGERFAPYTPGDVPPHRRSDGDPVNADPVPSVRLDRWLWAARMYRTRSLAATAVAGGKVDLGGRRARGSAPVRPGDEIRVRKPPFEFILEVRGLSDRRGSATEARSLYEETPDSRRERERIAYLRRHVPVPTYDGKGRPTKKARREIEALKRGPL